MTQKLKCIRIDKAAIKIRYPRTNNVYKNKERSMWFPCNYFLSLKKERRNEFKRKRLDRGSIVQIRFSSYIHK